MNTLSLLFEIKQKLLVVLPLLIFSLISHAGDQKLNDTNKILDGKMLDKTQLVVFESETCSSCKAFKKDVMANWKSSFSIEKTYSMQVPLGWELKESVWATPTIVMFEDGKETSRYTGYDGNTKEFWRWFGMQTLTPEQKNLIDNMIYGIRALSNFFDSVLTRGMQAEQALREDENARTEILQEDLS